MFGKKILILTSESMYNKAGLCGFPYKPTLDAADCTVNLERVFSQWTVTILMKYACTKHVSGGGVCLFSANERA